MEAIRPKLLNATQRNRAHMYSDIRMYVCQVQQTVCVFLGDSVINFVVNMPD